MMTRHIGPGVDPGLQEDRPATAGEMRENARALMGI